MNKGGMGVGSASIVLVFAVLCLTIFALITFTAAENDQALAYAEARLVKGYYEADVLAECVLAELLAAETIPGAVRDVEITNEWDWDLGAELAVFSCPISDQKELYVQVAVYEASYDILSWRMRDIGVWEADENISVWPGVEIDAGLPGLMDGALPLW